MSENKLSKTQQELLDAITGGTRVHYMPYMGNFNEKAYYFRCDTLKRRTAAARALLEKGLVEKCNTDFRGHGLKAKAAA
jgi:hypothetical protein